MLKQLLMNVFGRELLNKFSGMEKLSSKKIDYLDALKILNKFKGNIKNIEVTHNRYESSEIYNKKSLEEVGKYIKDQFKPLCFGKEKGISEYKTSCIGTYEKYEGKLEKTHYIDLQYGEVIKIKGEARFIPYKGTSLEFVEDFPFD